MLNRWERCEKHDLAVNTVNDPMGCPKCLVEEQDEEFRKNLPSKVSKDSSLIIFEAKT